MPLASWKRNLIVGTVALLAATPLLPQGDLSPEEEFFRDYPVRLLVESVVAWPYLAGRGDAEGELALHKFASLPGPAEMTAEQLLSAVEDLVADLVGRDLDAVDVLWQQNLFFEMEGLSQAHGEPSTSIHPRTCAARAVDREHPLPPPPWRPSDAQGAALSAQQTTALAGLTQQLCRHLAKEGLEPFLLSSQSLVARLAWLEADILENGSDDAVPKELDPRVDDPRPGAAQTLDWMEEHDTVVGHLDLLRRVRPDARTLHEAYLAELRTPQPRSDAIFDCREWQAVPWIGLVREAFVERALAPSRSVRSAPSEGALDGRPWEATALDTATSIDEALLTVAERSMREDPFAMVDLGVLRLRQETVGIREITAALENELSRAELLARFGLELGEALADHREELRGRLLEGGADPSEQVAVLHAAARLSNGVAVGSQTSMDESLKHLVWLPPERAAWLRSHMAVELRDWRWRVLQQVFDEGLGELRTEKDMPPSGMAIPRMRMLHAIEGCLEPFVDGGARAKNRQALLHARQNLGDRMHREMALALSADCDAFGSSLAERIRDLARRMLPDATPGLEPLILRLGLQQPCAAPPETTLLRYGALHDLMTAVVAVESYAAGAFFGAAFDRDVARAGDPPPRDELDAWVQAYRSALGTALGLPGGPPKRSFEEPNPAGNRTGFPTIWDSAYSDRIAGRGYPPNLATAGWHPLDDYIEEEKRRRRIDLTAQPDKNGFTVRVLFGPGLGTRELLGPDGQPSPASEWLTWARQETDLGAEYRIAYGSPEEPVLHLTIPVPRHPGAPGRESVEAARAFAALALRWGRPTDTPTE